MSEMAEHGPGGLIPEWTLGDRLRKVRRIGGLGQAEFAAELGTNQKTYASWETDKSAPRHAHLITIAKRIELITGIPASWVLGVESTPPGTDRTPPFDPLSQRDARQADENVVHVQFSSEFSDAAVTPKAA